MDQHPLIFELQKLKESSLQAVADGNSPQQDELKKYLHIPRPVEEDLKELILKTHHLPGPVLLLVCGNVGDGKSHILSTLAQDPAVKPSLAHFKIRNDATESFSPDQTCVDALDHTLEGFSDECLQKSQDKWILAINLGTLNNFLDEKGQKYQALYNFVKRNQILEVGQEENQGFDANSPFQFINFTNYHFYALTPNGAKGELIEALLERIMSPVQENPIYRAYQELLKFGWSENCPVKINYEFLFTPQHRERIAGLVVEIIIKEKQIISFRHLLNFLYDVLVPYEVRWSDGESYQGYLQNLEAGKKIEFFLPNYIFEHPELSPIFSSLSQIDPCRRRIESLDEQITQLFATADPAQFFLSRIPQADTYLERAIRSVKEDRMPILKAFIRITYFQDFSNALFDDDYFSNYTKALYAYNQHNVLELRHTYEIVKEAILKWNGNAKEKGMMALKSDSKDPRYRLFKEAHFKPVLPKPKSSQNPPVLHQFYAQLSLLYDGTGGGDQLRIDIDYPLYVLLMKVNGGYRPNKLNKHNYLSFDRFVERLTLTDAQDAPLFVDEANVGLAVDYKLFIDDYGGLKFEKV